jgi:hypothetical protein
MLRRFVAQVAAAWLASKMRGLPTGIITLSAPSAVNEQAPVCLWGGIRSMHLAIRDKTANKRAGGKGRIASLFHAAHPWPALPQHHRSQR